MIALLKLVDAKSWMGLFGILLGATLGLSGVLFTSRSNLKQLQFQLEHERVRNNSEIKRDRLEELYVLLSHWNNMFFSQALTLTLVMEQRIDYDQYLDDQLANTNLEQIDFQRLEMIINIYGRELIPSYNKVLNCRENINKITGAHKHDYKNGITDGNKYVPLYLDAQSELYSSIDALKQHVAALAAKI